MNNIAIGDGLGVEDYVNGEPTVIFIFYSLLK